VTLGEMLGVLRADILHDRSDRIEGDEDHLWSDTTLILYIDQAVRRWARRTLCIRDGVTPQYTQITTVAFQKEYPLDPAVLAIISAHFMGNGTYIDGVYTLTDPPNAPGTALIYPDFSDLARAAHDNFDTYHVPDTYFFNPNELSTLPPGKPLAYSTDEYTSSDTGGSVGVMNFRSFPIPSAEYANCVVQFRVARLPKAHLTQEDLSVVPEIPEDYHLDVLDFAAYLALRIVDHELGDPARAEEFLQAFNMHMDDCKAEMAKKAFQPNLWGFGRSGFSYVGN
jgi:hypothetical protein